MPVPKAEIQAGIDRQNRVIDALTDLLTGERLTSEDLRHFAVVRYAFRPQLDATLSRLVDPEFGKPELARGLLVGLLLHVVERLLSPQPDAVEVRQSSKAPTRPGGRKERKRFARLMRAVRLRAPEQPRGMQNAICYQFNLGGASKEEF
jgi:hypothetical protein